LHSPRKVDVRITSSGLDLLKIVDPLVGATGRELANRLTKDEAGILNLLLDKVRG